MDFGERRISLEDLQSMAFDSNELWATPDPVAASPVGSDNAWVCFEAEVRRANASALSKIRHHGPHWGGELLRLLEIEEQTRCQAFQATLMGEVRPSVYVGTVRSILEKLLGKLETFSAEPALYQSAAQCLSEYLSSLNHHSDICAVPGGTAPLPAIEEGRDYGELSSDVYSERSEDTDTLSVHSEQMFTSTESPAAMQQNEAGGFCFGMTGLPLAAPAAVAMSLEDIRKERRRESNKKAASKYRSKKTVTMQQVLNESQQLRQQMAGVVSQNAVLAAENNLLKQQSRPSEDSPPSLATSSAAHELSHRTPRLRVRPRTAHVPPLGSDNGCSTLSLHDMCLNTGARSCPRLRVCSFPT